MVRALLKKYGIQGGYHDQHFLVDEQILDKIVEAAHLGDEETVLEIGAGIGNLTILLADCARKVIAIELDPVHVEDRRKCTGHTGGCA